MIRLIHCMMVLAIFNPFCCCTAAVFAIHDDAKAEPIHSCCQAESAVDYGDSAPNKSHDTGTCPHQAFKDYQIFKDHNDCCMLDSFALTPALLLLEYTPLAARYDTGGDITLVTTSTAPPGRLSQVYCVYRI